MAEKKSGERGKGRREWRGRYNYIDERFVRVCVCVCNYNDGWRPYLVSSRGRSSRGRGEQRDG